MKIMFRLISVMLLSVAALPALAGKAFSVEGNMLWAEMQNHLISAGLCTKKEQCSRVAAIYRRDGKYIEMNLYAASDEVIQELFGFVAAHGLRITKGKPIILNAFPKPKENYVNSFKGSMENRKPLISLRLSNDT